MQAVKDKSASKEALKFSAIPDILPIIPKGGFHNNQNPNYMLQDFDQVKGLDMYDNIKNQKIDQMNV